MTSVQLKALIVTPMLTGAVSCIASITIIISIKMSKIKLSNMYRRLIFSTCFFDIFQSVSQAVSTVPIPKGYIWGAAGNNVSCSIQGFFLVFGTSGAVWYSASLTLYFLLVVVGMPEAKLKNVERYLHAFPILYALAVSILIYAMGNYNPNYTVCWIAENPSGCLDDPSVECKSKGNPEFFQWLSVGAPIFAVFALNCSMLALIWWNMYHQDKTSHSYRHSWVTGPGSDGNEAKENKGIFGCMRRHMKEKVPTLSPLAKRLSRPSTASVQRNKEISYRAMAYICGYVCTYGATAIYRILFLYGHAPYAVIYIARFTFPLQGLFNILVYTYPHVMSAKRHDSNLSWLGAFWFVVKSGGDRDVERRGRTNRRPSVRKMKLLESKYNLKSPNDFLEEIEEGTLEAPKNESHPEEESKEEIA